MTIDRRRFTKLAGLGTAGAAVAWQQACVQVERDGEVSEETVRVLLEAQGRPTMYDDPEELQRLRRAIGNAARISEELRSFDLDDDEQPLTVFRRG